MPNPEPQTPQPRQLNSSSSSNGLSPACLRDAYDASPAGAIAQGRNASTSSTNNLGVNEQGVRQNAGVTLSFPANDEPPNCQARFQTNTIAPSPPPSRTSTLSAKDSSLTPLDTSSQGSTSDSPGPQSSTLSAGLRIQTDIIPNYIVTAASAQNTARSMSESTKAHLGSASIPIKRTPSIKNILASSVGSNSGALSSTPNSAWSSPMLNAMADVTPLPSPLMSGDSPGPWKKLGSMGSRPVSRDIMINSDACLVTANGESISSAVANQIKRRTYQGLMSNSGDSSLQNAQINPEKTAEGHTRNRSMSEYVPDTMQVPKARHVTVSGSHAPILDGSSDNARPTDNNMRREPHLAVQRGLAGIPRPPTPPSSRTGGESSDSDSSLSNALPRLQNKAHYEYFEAVTRQDSKRRRWRGLKLLGQGTFSKVILATSQRPDLDDRIDEDQVFGQSMDGIITPVQAEPKIDRKKLVAIKICEHGPKGGASEERVEMSLKRELEIMKSINHPSLVHLTAFSIEETRAILVLSYCPGGDLFEVASQHRDVLVPGLLRRMFAELVGAVRYLHERHIVHRDIKLENVLVNIPHLELSRPTDWATYPYSVITLTDLGLSRRVADDEKLTTRCGSDDYAAPEVIMGQPYDGRATDAWSLGVLLYALLESRLPFDPNPAMPEGHKQRSRTSHRIARVEWRWIEYAGDEGDHEGNPDLFRERDLEGAMIVTENLLKRARSRWTMDQVAKHDWVENGIVVEGGIKFREEETPEEVLSSGGDMPTPL